MEIKGWFHCVIGQVPGWLSRGMRVGQKRHGLVLLEKMFYQRPDDDAKGKRGLKKKCINCFYIVSVKFKAQSH